MPGEKQALSRRELLKALTALGGAVAASMLLPDKWAKPQVGSGVLPAHAQSTYPCVPPYEIVDCVLGTGTSNEGVHVITEVFIYPPCSGIELQVMVVPIFEDSASVISESEDQIIVTTDTNGKATYNNLFVGLPFITIGFIASWEFNSQEDGSGTCSRTSYLSQRPPYPGPPP